MRRVFKIVIVFCLAVATIGLLLLGYAYFIEPNRLVVNQHEIKIDGLDPEFDGMKFVLISDIHGGSHGSSAANLRRMVDTANAQNADAIFLLGDHVAGTNNRTVILMPVPQLSEILSGLRAKYGVFAVLGNHEGWYGEKYVAEGLQQAGIKVLNGGVAFIERNGKRLRLLGLRDHEQFTEWKKMSNDAKGLLAPSEGTGGVIALQHSPDVLPMITGDLLISKDLKVMFAGHTHGGQVRFPIIGAPIIPSSYGQKYAAGHVKDGGIDLFVTTGIGTGVLPFRFMVPPEIAVITLRSN